MSLWSIALIVLGVYLALFALFFFFPGLIHSKRTFRLSQRALNSKFISTFSHRGGQKEFPENSLSAFRHSIKLGYFGLELDVHKCRCGTFVVAHDHSLLRSTGQDVMIKDIDYASIGNYLPVIHDAWSDVEDDFRHLTPEKPPVFEDLLKMVKGENVMMSVDLKSNCPDDFGEVCQLIVKYGLEDRVVVGGFASDLCKKKMREMRIAIPMFFDVKDCVVFFIGTLFGLLPFLPFKNDWLMIPHAFEGFYGGIMFKKYKLAKVVGAIFWIQKWVFPLIAWHMNRRGVPVVFWVLNCEEDWKQGIWMGANGLMTDLPKKMKEYLESRGKFGPHYLRD